MQVKENEIKEDFLFHENNKDNENNIENIEEKNKNEGAEENEEKDESLFVKSIDENNCDLVKFVNENENFNVDITPLNLSIQLFNKSLTRIFKLFSLNENLADVYSTHITFLVIEGTISDDEVEKNISGIIPLEEKYKNVLDKTKKFLISFAKTNNNKDANDNQKIDFENRIKKNKDSLITKESLKKIFRLIKRNIYEMSDFIEIKIINLIDNPVDASTIQNKILSKYSGPIDFEIIGKKNFICLLDVPKKNEQNIIYTLDKLFLLIEKFGNGRKTETTNTPFENGSYYIPKKVIEEDIFTFNTELQENVNIAAPPSNKSERRKEDKKCNNVACDCIDCLIF